MREHDFSQTLDQWETAVFDAADLFVVSLFVGPRPGKSPFERREFDRLPQAICAAYSWSDQWGRRPIVTAVSPSGRSVVLDSEHYSKWLARWVRNANREWHENLSTENSRPLHF